MTQDNKQGFDALKGRLDEIVKTVSDENLSLDQALDLYEEAVGIGLSVSRLMEEGLAERAAAEEAAQTAGEGRPGQESNVTISSDLGVAD